MISIRASSLEVSRPARALPMEQRDSTREEGGGSREQATPNALSFPSSLLPAPCSLVSLLSGWLASALVAVALVTGTTGAQAQYIDARLVPRGALRIDASPHYTNYDMRFSFGTLGLPDGTAEPLGTDLTADTVGSNLFPDLAPAETAIRDVIGDAMYRINVGTFNTVRDADERRFPFGFALGLTDRITLRANVPIVTTRSQITFTSDSTDANVGWNVATVELGDETTSAQAALLLQELQTAITEVEMLIAGGSFGCPSGPACAPAQAAVDRANLLLDNLRLLTGLGADEAFVPFAPLATSAAGTAITGGISGVATELQALGSSLVTATLPLPASKLAEDDINQLLTSPGLGFDAEPLSFSRQTKLGDIEIGARIGVLANPSARVVVSSTLRLPTGRPSQADHYVDIGTGDDQIDAELGIEAAFEPGQSVGVSFGASYALQLPHNLERRVTTPDAPLAQVSRQTLVRRNLGDVLQLRAYPTVRLSNEFRVFGSVHYYRKGSDSFDVPGAAAPSPAFASLAPLEAETEMRALSFGGGIAYRSDQTTSGRALPLEAGLNYRAAFSGSGGLTPKRSSMQVYLRLFFRAFGEGVDRTDGQ